MRLWVDGKLMIDSWEGVRQGKAEGWYRTENYSSGPIPLTAGQRVPIKLEYSAAGEKEAHLHLYWESRSNELRHVPQKLLYPPQP